MTTPTCHSNGQEVIYDQPTERKPLREGRSSPSDYVGLETTYRLVHCHGDVDIGRRCGNGGAERTQQGPLSTQTLLVFDDIVIT